MSDSKEEVEQLINDVWALQRKLIAESDRLCEEVAYWKAINNQHVAENERLRGLLADKQYIQLKADYNNGHLSHAGWLKAREGRSE